MVTYKPGFVAEIQPIAERICSLGAAARFQATVARNYEDGSVVGAGKAQAALNKGDEYLNEASRLLAQGRAIARKHGHTLPGMKALAKLAGSH